MAQLQSEYTRVGDQLESEQTRIMQARQSRIASSARHLRSPCTTAAVSTSLVHCTL